LRNPVEVAIGITDDRLDDSELKALPSPGKASVAEMSVPQTYDFNEVHTSCVIDQATFVVSFESAAPSPSEDGPHSSAVFALIPSLTSRDRTCERAARTAHDVASAPKAPCSSDAGRMGRAREVADGSETKVEGRSIWHWPTLKVRRPGPLGVHTLRDAEFEIVAAKIRNSRPSAPAWSLTIYGTADRKVPKSCLYSTASYIMR
jgi:hypothetical protein